MPSNDEKVYAFAKTLEEIEKKPNEIFLPVPYTANRYHISNYGRIYSVPRLMLIAPNKNGYITCQRMNPRGHIVPESVSVGKFVLRSFKPNIAPGKYIHHLDKNPQNNHVDNLVWTHKRTL